MEKLTSLTKLLTDSKTTKGVWKIDDKNTLSYKADGAKEEITLAANLIAAEPGALVFSYTDRISANRSSTRMFKLDGRWALDEKNRITFEIEKETGKNDVLTFQGAWKLNDAHEIVFSSVRKRLKTKTTMVHELLFKGHWDIDEKNRLAYYFSGDTDNAFHFKGTFEKRAARAKEGELRYNVGVEVKGKKRVKAIVLFGEWIVSKDLSLDFEIEYADGDKRTIAFGGEYQLTEDRAIAVKLKSKSGAPIGVELLITQDILGKDGQAFVRLQKAVDDTRIEAGMKFRW